MVGLHRSVGMIAGNPWHERNVGWYIPVMTGSLYRVPNSLMLLGLFCAVAALAADWLGAPDSTLWVPLFLVGVVITAVGLLTGFLVSIGSIFLRRRPTVVVVEIVSRQES